MGCWTCLVFHITVDLDTVVHQQGSDLASVGFRGTLDRRHQLGHAGLEVTIQSDADGGTGRAAALRLYPRHCTNEEYHLVFRNCDYGLLEDSFCIF